jgi:hypothetical protein
MYNVQERKILKKLNTPAKIQDFLNSLKINFEEKGETCMSPRRVLRKRKAHCMEAAMLASAALQFHGYKPLVIDLRAERPDNDHIVTVFRANGAWGGITKTNHAVLRYREPIYKSIRELAMSFFHEYFDDKGLKTLREYTQPINLSHFDKKSWQTAEEDLFDIPDYIDAFKHYPLISKQQIKNLRKADKIEIAAGELIEWKLSKGKTLKNV